MKSYEVAVIGGGPAGSTCAWILADVGLPVLLMDRETFPREKPCAGWVTPEVFDRLKIDPRRYAEENLLQEIKSFRTGPIYGKEIETSYPSTVSYGIRRSEFDHFLIKRCEAEKALGEPMRSLEKSSDGWVINGEIKAAVVVGAGGHHCPVAQALGAKPSGEAAIAAMVAEYGMTDGEAAESLVPPGVPILSFTEDLKGYGWLLRKGNLLNLGLGSLNTTDVSGQVKRFASYMREKYRLPAGAVEGMRGHAYLTYAGTARRKLVDDGVILIGDAAGLSFPESGEGILPAIESAYFAAEAIVAAPENYTRQRLHRYEWALDVEFGRKGTSCELPERIRRLAGSFLLSNRYLTRRLVLDRWFLHNEQ